MAGHLILWGVGTSRTFRPHWALHELGLQYDVRPILPRAGETKTPEFTALSPRQKIPLLQDKDFTIGESAAIIAYLAGRYGRSGSNSLVPEEPMFFARWLEWCFFILTELDSSLYVMRRHGTIKGLAHLYGHAPDVVRRAGEYFREQLPNVDIALRDGRSYLMGDQFTTADILLTTCLTWAIDYGVGICESAEPYLARTTARPAYLAGQQANRPKGRDAP